MGTSSGAGDLPAPTLMGEPVTTLRVVFGPRDDWFTDATALTAGEWRVSPQSNRVGVRLDRPDPDPPALERRQQRRDPQRGNRSRRHPGAAQRPAGAVPGRPPAHRWLSGRRRRPRRRHRPGRATPPRPAPAFRARLLNSTPNPPRRYEMSAPTQAARPGRGALVKAYAASLTGTALEYYDFAVYSAAAALVFPQLFFPGEDPLTGTLLSFSTYAVGFLARPVGGVIFGRLGDKIGRKNVLVSTLRADRRRHRADRPAARLRRHRRGRADHPGAAAVRAGRRRRRRVGRRGAALQRIRRPEQARLLGLRRADRPTRRQPDGQRRARRAGRRPDRGGVPELGLAGRVPDLRGAGRVRPVDPAQAGGHPGLPGHQGERRTAEGSDQGGLRHPEAGADRRRAVPGRPGRAVRAVHRVHRHLRHHGAGHEPQPGAHRRAHRFRLPAVPDPARPAPCPTGSTAACCTPSPPSGRPSGCRCSS